MTKAYAITPSSNGIYIRRDKIGGGPLATDLEYAEFRDKLMASLLAFRDPSDGRPVVTRVRTREEAYPGAEMHLAPDRLLTLRDAGFGSILNADPPLKRRAEVVGTHRPAGVFVANGPGIRAGISVPPLSILDIAPILLHSLGLPIPEDLEG